ncbi:MAG: ABC transporter permease, partial [bacterium]
ATRYRNVEIRSRYGPIRLVAVAPAEEREAGIQLLSGRTEVARTALREGDGVLVSEPLAFRTDLDPGSILTLETALGERSFEVAGVYRDYGSEQGVVMMGRDLYRRLWRDPGVSSLALYGGEGVSPDTLVRRIREAGAASSRQRISVVSNRELREGSLQVFDRTFAITRVLRMLAFVVAFIGILSALMALQLERGRELGVLRANGLTPGQVWQMVTAQTGLLGTVCGVLAVPLGVVLALVMVHVVNRRSFGWSLDLDLSWSLVGQSVGLAVLGALLAGLYPAWKMARTSPAVALREE